MGVRTVSPNGREFLSKYFVIGEKEYKPADDALDRYYVQIIVLGDRRPYDIEISATREKRVLRGEDFTYVVTGHDRRLAKELVTQLREQLTKRREDRNIIDDFRVF